MLSYICDYFILDGRNKRVHKFHFVFLNHFRHKDRLSFPFYLQFSLLHSLQDHKKKVSQPILHESLILLIEGYCKNKYIASNPSKDKHKDSHSIKSKKEENAKGKEKVLKLKPLASQKHIVEEDSESENMEIPKNENPDEEDGIDFRYLSSNLEGYPKCKGKNEKGNDEAISEGNSDQINSKNEGNQIVSSGGDKGKDNIVENLVQKRKEDHMIKPNSPPKGTEEQNKKDLVHNEDSVGTRKEDQMEREEHIDKANSPPHEIAKDNSDSMQRETKLSFLHSAKIKSDSMLKVDSWIYNELIGLFKKVETLQHNQDIVQAKIIQLDKKMGDIPNKLNNYEKNLRMLIKESGTKMK